MNEHHRCQAQQSVMPRFRDAAASLKGNLEAVTEVERACREAKIDEIDLGASTVKDFQFELDLLADTIKQKEVFIENRKQMPGICTSKHLRLNALFFPLEIRAASTTNVTADQLGEWEEVWQRFEMEPNDVCLNAELSKLDPLTLGFCSTWIITNSIRPWQHWGSLLLWVAVWARMT